MPDYGLTVVGLAEAVGVSRQSINELLRGRRVVSPEMALRLSCLFGNSAEFWLNAQRSIPSGVLNAGSPMWTSHRRRSPRSECSRWRDLFAALPLGSLPFATRCFPRHAVIYSHTERGIPTRMSGRDNVDFGLSARPPIVIGDESGQLAVVGKIERQRAGRHDRVSERAFTHLHVP